MQSDTKEIYRITAEREGKPEQMYKALGNFVFSSLYKMVRNPKSLIIKLKGVGSWHLRKRRMEIIVNNHPREELKPREEYPSEYSYLEHKEKRERYELFSERLKEYNEYISIKREIQKKRNEAKVLLETNKEEDQSFKSS
jgi:hypothetical protein